MRGLAAGKVEVEERMDANSPSSVSFLNNATVRRWISRAFIVSILVYFIVLGYLIAESVTGASRWAPYGVNIPIFIGLVIGSELVMLVTAIRIFREDSGIWPTAISEGWSTVKGGSIVKGSAQMLTGAWDISLIDLRLRTGTAILMGRLNRFASLVPLVYALAASAGGAPWGLRGSAIFDIGISLIVWAFMELVMVRPNEDAAAAHETAASDDVGKKQSRYSVRLVRLSDLDRLEELERRNWKDEAASREVIAERISTYPEGQVAAIHTTVENGVPTRSRVVGWCTFMPANEKHVEGFATWDDLTSNGTISACDPDGDVIVGVNVTSVTEGGTFILMAEMLAAVVGGGKDRLIGGGRLTGFVSFNERRQAESKEPLSADAYARLREIRGFRINEIRRDEGKEPLRDEEYCVLAADMRREAGASPLAEEDTPDYVCSNGRGYMSIPCARLVRGVPNYFRDPASADYGVVLDWPNPIPRPARHIPIIKRFVMRRIREEIADEWEQRKQHLRDLAVRRAKKPIPAYLRKNGSSPAAGDAIDEPAVVEEVASEKSALRRP